MRGVDLLQLLAGATLLPRDFGSVQQLDQGIQAGKRAAETSHRGGLRRAGPLHIQPLAVGGVAAIHARQQGGQQVPGVIQQNFDPLGDVGRQQVGGIADQGVQLGNSARVDMVKLLADGRPPADARWRTVRVGVPETQQLKSEGKIDSSGFWRIPTHRPPKRGQTMHFP